MRRIADRHRQLKQLYAAWAVRGFAVFLVLCVAMATLHAQSLNVDLSQGASFKFKIAPSLPEFTFKVIPNTPETDGNGNAQSTIEAVEVYRGDAQKPMQSLEGCEWSNMEPPPAGSDWFRAQDMNFDSYNDLYILTNWGATGNQYGCVFLYSPATGRFNYSKEFSELSRFSLDASTKTILTFDNGGMAGLVYNANRYHVEDNKPVLFWAEKQDWSFDTNQFHCAVQERKDAAMVTTRDEWSKPGADWGNVDAPCDPGRFFDRPAVATHP